MTTTKAMADWLSKLDPSQRSIVEAVSKAVRAAIPEIEEGIKWGGPVFCAGKNIAYLKAAKSHITFGYFEGAGLDDPDDLLTGTGKQMRSIKLRDAAEVPSAAIVAWTKQAHAFAAGSRV